MEAKNGVVETHYGNVLCMACKPRTNLSNLVQTLMAYLLYTLLAFLAFVKQIKTTKMGELKFSMYFKWQIAVGIEYDGQIIIRMPFITTHISLSKYAKGFEIFGWYR